MIRIRWFLQLLQLHLQYVTREPYDVQANRALAAKINDHYFNLSCIAQEQE